MTYPESVKVAFVYVEPPSLLIEAIKSVFSVIESMFSSKTTILLVVGTVLALKAVETIVVEVTRKFKHPFYEKVIKRSKKYHAHDEKNKFKEGEKVKIIECRPISKKKTWQVVEK